MVPPVQRFDVSTRDESEAEEFIRLIYTGNRARFLGGGEDARLTATAAHTPGIGGDHFRSTVDYSLECEPLDHYVFFTVYSGCSRLSRGHDEVVVPAGGSSFYPLGRPLGVDFADLGMRVLRLPADRLATTAEQTAGIAPADLRFHALTPVSPGAARRWSGLIELAGALLLAGDPAAVPPVLAEELARTAAVAALHTFPSTAMSAAYGRGPGWAAPASARRAAGFIDAHAAEPLTLDRIAAAAGVSGRALQQTFRRHYGVSPLGHLRRVRLEHARRDLRRTHDAGLVEAVARRWGWAGVAGFTAAYRRQFRVSPRDDLGRPR